MHIKCWGARGSIPVSGKEYAKFGGDTTCLEIRARSGDIIIIDAGTGVRKLGNKLFKEMPDTFHFIFTHAHWDHLVGFPFFKPLYLDRFNVVMHKCPYHNKFVETVLSTLMSAPYFPVKYRDLDAKVSYQDACPSEFEIGSLRITPIPLSHPNGGSGYKFTEGDKSFVFLTDNELGFIHPGGLTKDEYARFSTGADLLIHDAEYTPKEYARTVKWGHSNYSDVLDLAVSAGVKKLGMFHINSERTDSGMDKIVETCKGRLKERNSGAECFAVSGDMEFDL